MKVRFWIHNLKIKQLTTKHNLNQPWRSYEGDGTHGISLSGFWIATTEMAPRENSYLVQPWRSEGDGAHGNSWSGLQPQRFEGDGTHGKSWSGLQHWDPRAMVPMRNPFHGDWHTVLYANVILYIAHFFKFAHICLGLLHIEYYVQKLFIYCICAKSFILLCKIILFYSSLTTLSGLLHLYVVSQIFAAEIMVRFPLRDFTWVSPLHPSQFNLKLCKRMNNTLCNTD